MTTTILVILVLVSIAAAKECTTCCNGRSSGSTNNDIDYVQLAVQSAKGFCEVCSNWKYLYNYIIILLFLSFYLQIKNCDTDFNGWSIHGLWSVHHSCFVIMIIFHYYYYRPSQKGAMGPNSCNTTAAFNPDYISVSIFIIIMIICLLSY